MQEKTLHEIEYEVWSQRASIYDDLFASVSRQAIVYILDSLGTLKSKRHLDMACGTGHLVAAASQRGAVSEGVDFARAMIDVAQTNYPDNRFKMADARQLPYEDNSFDTASCAFGLSHMESPQLAIQEAFRVLKTGGRFAFTLWFDADNGGELQAMCRDALTRYGTTTIDLPESWTRLRYADQSTCQRIVIEAGFSQPTFQRLPITMQSKAAQSMLDIVLKLSFRTKMIFDKQTSTAQQRIYEYILSEAENRRKEGVITMSWPALLTVAQKPEPISGGPSC